MSALKLIGQLQTHRVLQFKAFQQKHPYHLPELCCVHHTRYTTSAYKIRDFKADDRLSIHNDHRHTYVMYSNHMQLSKPGPWKPCSPHKNRITSIQQLITEYPYWFEGTGYFPSYYKVHLHGYTLPIIHTSLKCPIAVRPLVKKEIH